MAVSRKPVAKPADPHSEALVRTRQRSVRSSNAAVRSRAKLVDQPTAQTKPSTLPSVWAQISAANVQGGDDHAGLGEAATLDAAPLRIKEAASSRQAAFSEGRGQPAARLAASIRTSRTIQTTTEAMPMARMIFLVMSRCAALPHGPPGRARTRPAVTVGMCRLRISRWSCRACYGPPDGPAEQVRG